MDFVRDGYGKRALDFVEDMQKISDPVAVCERIVEELAFFGFDYVTIGEMPGPGETARNRVFLNNRPDDYSEYYEKKDLIYKDPVMLALPRNIMPYAWEDVRQQGVSRAGRRIMDEARDFGANEGLIVPIFTLDGGLSLFSLCGREPNLTPRARSALEMIGIYSHQALRRALQGERQRGGFQPLTPREREVMKWVATGKSDDEIAEILTISRATATSHVENAKMKLNATRRTYAVVQALRSGEITL